MLQRPRRPEDGQRTPDPLPALQSRRSLAGRHRPLPPAQSRGQQRAAEHPRARVRTAADSVSCETRAEYFIRGLQVMRSSERRATTESRRHGEKLDSSLDAFLRASVSPWWVLPLLLVVANVFARAQTITFRDITAQAGIHFTHNNGAFGKK